METSDTHVHYTPCQIKFAFDVDMKSPLAWFEYFGWESEFDMLNAFCQTNLKSSTVELSQIDVGCSKLTVIFETSCAPESFLSDYNTVLTLLALLDKDPAYNLNERLLQEMLETLDEHEVKLDWKDSKTKIFHKFNSIKFSHPTHTDRLKAINQAKINA